MTNIEAAAQVLSRARRESRFLERLPESCGLANDDEALLVQRRIMELLGQPIGGWKVSLPQPRGVFVAPLPASTILSKSPCPVLLHGSAVKIEPEIAFVIGEDLSPRAQAYEENDLCHAVATTHLVLELIGSRFSDPNAVPFPENLADCIQNQALFVGPEVQNPFDKKLEGFPIRIKSQESVLFDRETRHPNGHPVRPLVWLANFLSGRRETLKAGQIVTTGSYAGVVQVPADKPISVEFGAVGTLNVQFSAGRS